MTGLQSPVGVRSIVTYLVAFFILASSIIFLFDKGHQDHVQMAVDHGRQEVQVKVEAELQEPAMRETTEVEDTSKEECNWSRGQWVYDNVSRPLYSGLKCGFIFPEVACDKYGRKDVMYQHWRWQPYECDLPRYDTMTYFTQFSYCQLKSSSISKDAVLLSSVSIRVKNFPWVVNDFVSQKKNTQLICS